MESKSKNAGDLRDRDVRQCLHRRVLKEHHSDRNTLVLDELGLRHGACRVDIAVINSRLHGYEIKSDADTLRRLPQQVLIYSAVLDVVTLVVGRRHVKKIEKKIPAWWGIEVAYSDGADGISFEMVRQSNLNPNVDPVALAELLWRNEVARLLEQFGVSSQILRKRRALLYQCLCERLTLEELRGTVRNTLKARERWRGHSPLSSSVD